MERVPTLSRDIPAGLPPSTSSQPTQLTFLNCLEPAPPSGLSPWLTKSLSPDSSLPALSPEPRVQLGLQNCQKIPSPDCTPIPLSPLLLAPGTLLCLLNGLLAYHSRHCSGTSCILTHLLPLYR